MKGKQPSPIRGPLVPIGKLLHFLHQLHGRTTHLSMSRVSRLIGEKIEFAEIFAIRRFRVGKGLILWHNYC